MNDHLNDFDRWLDDELGSSLNRAAGPAPTPAEPLYRAQAHRSASWTRLPILGSVPLALGTKAVVAFAAAALATGGAAAIVVTQHSGGSGSHQTLVNASSSASSSTTDGDARGDAVQSAVAKCKAARPSPDARPKPTPGSRGIGECVSAVASDGRADATDTPESAQTESSSATTDNGKGNGGVPGNGGVNGNAGGNSAEHTPNADHPTPNADHPTPNADHPTPNPNSNHSSSGSSGSATQPGQR